MGRSGRSGTVLELVPGPWKAKIVAKCRALVVVTKQSPATQFRQHQLDKVLEPTRKRRRQDHEAVGSLVFEGLLQLIRDRLRTTDDQHVSATNGDLIEDIAHRHV